jgi:hypothetical protein
MNHAYKRFETPLLALETLLKETSSKRDKGAFFYKNKARDIYFRLEALGRLYRNIHDKKLFELWYKEFKTFEDLLGQIDYNESMHQLFGQNKKLRSKCDKLFGAKQQELLKTLQQKISNDGWLTGEKIQNIRVGLQQASWLDMHEDRSAYGREMIRELEKLEEKYRNGELNPFQTEEGLHEFRRKLRWFGIYSIASSGMVQLLPNKLVSDCNKKYTTKEIVTSPYNQMPKPMKNELTIMIQSNHFYAISWLIQQLGNWKDAAQNHEAMLSLGGIPTKEEEKKYREIPEQAQHAIDVFIYEDDMLNKTIRDIKRSIQ